MSVRETLLNLDSREKRERERVEKDFYYYKGKARTTELADNSPRWGQSWKVNDNLGYTPTQKIINHTKRIIKKQARFMFSVPPDIQYIPDSARKDDDKLEVLRKTIDDIFEDNHFWNNTRKAFLMSTIEKRILLRVEMNKEIGVRLKYERIQDFNYKEANGKLLRVDFFEEDENNVFKDEEENEKIYYMHRYYYDEGEVIYQKDTYTGGELAEPSSSEINKTGLTSMPCWVIKNGGELNSLFGDSDVELLKDGQDSFNRGVSDYEDALKFQMFGMFGITDGLAEDVNNLKVVPGGVAAIRSNTPDNGGNGTENTKAALQILEYNMSNASAMNDNLDRTVRDMESLLDMPNIKDLNNIPSAKAMRYLYNDLICRCEEKWNDWEPVLRDLIKFLIEYAQTVMEVPGEFKRAKVLDFSINFKHNYPLPSDEEEKKKTAMEEVVTGVESIQGYIKKFSDEEDSKTKFKEIIEEKTLLSGAELGDFQTNTTSKTIEDQEEEETEEEEDERKEEGRE